MKDIGAIQALIGLIATAITGGLFTFIINMFVVRQKNGTVKATAAEELWDLMANQLERNRLEILESKAEMATLRVELDKTKADAASQLLSAKIKEAELIKEINLLREQIAELQNKIAGAGI